MPLVFVTGNSGVGKTTITAELAKRGYEAHDVDEYSSFHEKETGKKVEHTSRKKEWYERHEWKIPVMKVKELSRRGKGSLVFLCGGAENEREMWSLLDSVIYLAVDADTLKHRLLTRTNNEYGKAPDEMARAMSWHEEIEDHYRRLGAKFVDATRSIPKIVDEILRVVEDK